MTRVDFYILPHRDIAERHRFACKLVEKAFRLGHSIYIHSDDRAQADAIDRLLWGFRESSFIPHRVTEAASPGPDNREPVHIGYSDHVTHPTTAGARAPADLLVNLSLGIPECFSRFDRVSEIVVQDPQIQAATRANFRFYRDRGYQLQTHDLRK